ncbi:MAG: NAD(P)/FAD-dependent oxidoreductase, partial [Clostridiaceae bacterium]
MMAAIAAAGCGHEVTVLERNKIIGRKLYITGKGRCNVTNASDISDFFPSIPRNPEFLYSALYTYSNVQLMDWLKERGLKLKTERGQRVFPLSDKSSDVIGVFCREMERLDVTIEYETQVQGSRHTGGQITGLVTSRGLKTADHYILAAGGGSYPLTGSDGGILGMLKGLGIKTQPFTPSLIPLTVKEPEVVQLAGVSLKNVTFTLREGKRVLYQELGEMLFTHDGVSGPLVLSASCLRTQGSMHCEIDLKPGLTEELLDARILRDFAKYQNKDLANGLSDLLIGRLIPLILERAKIPPDTKVHSVTKQQRRALLESIKHLTFTVKGTRPLAEAIISRGGVDVSEVDPSTMKLIRYSNGSVCGELIDVDAFTGGYNLQIAFSTGHLAGV